MSIVKVTPGPSHHILASRNKTNSGNIPLLKVFTIRIFFVLLLLSSSPPQPPLSAHSSSSIVTCVALPLSDNNIIGDSRKSLNVAKRVPLSLSFKSLSLRVDWRNNNKNYYYKSRHNSNNSYRYNHNHRMPLTLLRQRTSSKPSNSDKQHHYDKLNVRGGGGTYSGSSDVEPPLATSPTNVSLSSSKTTNEYKPSKVRSAVFPIYGKEVKKFILMGSIKFFVIMALTLTRDTKDTLVVTQCGAEAIAFLKVRCTVIKSAH